MTTTDYQTPKDTAEVNSPAGVSCAAAYGSVSHVEAVRGYMKNRQALCVALSEISSTYERETTRHKRIVDEIVRIDGCVKDILDSQNAERTDRANEESEK